MRVRLLIKSHFFVRSLIVSCSSCLIRGHHGGLPCSEGFNLKYPTVAAANLKPDGPNGKAGPIIQVGTFAHHTGIAVHTLLPVLFRRVFLYVACHVLHAPASASMQLGNTYLECN